MNVREYDAVVVSNKDPEGRNRVKIRVQGHHAGDMPEDELPWCLIQPKTGSNSGKGQKDTLTEGQFCKVQPLDTAETEFKVVGGSNAFRNPNNKKGKPYSVIENSELFDVPVPDLASCDPSKLSRTIFVPLMDNLTKRISNPINPFVGTCGTIDDKADPNSGGAGGGKPGEGGVDVPKPGADGTCPLPHFQPRIRCRPNPKSTPAKPLAPVVNCKKFNLICGCKPINYNMKFDWERSVQTLSGEEIWVPCAETDIEVNPLFKKPGDPFSGCWEKNGHSCEGIDVDSNKQNTVVQDLSLCFAENIPCAVTEPDPNNPNRRIMGLQTNTMKLVATSKIPGDTMTRTLPGGGTETVQTEITVLCEFYCGSNTCEAAKNCPGGENNKFASDDPFGLDITDLHEIGFTPTKETGIDTVEIDLEASDAPRTRSAAHATSKKLTDQSEKYIHEMFGNQVNQANRILGEVQASSTRSVNTAVDGAIKVVDNKKGTSAVDDALGGVEKIPIKPIDQAPGGFGLGGVPGAFFHEVIRTDFLGKTENKFVTQYENGIAQVVDTSRGNKTWSVATNDGARIEIANNGTALLKGANDVQIATEAGTVSVTGANHITIVDGKATIHCDSFSVKAKTVNIAAPAIALNGDVEISGKLGVGKSIEANDKIFSKSDVVAQKSAGDHVSLYKHVHSKVKVGTALSGAAQD